MVDIRPPLSREAIDSVRICLCFGVGMGKWSLSGDSSAKDTLLADLSIAGEWMGPSVDFVVVESVGDGKAAGPFGRGVSIWPSYKLAILSISFGGTRDKGTPFFLYGVSGCRAYGKHGITAVTFLIA